MYTHLFSKLKYFITLAETQNVSKTAALTFTSQPNVSKQIHDLENAFKTPLFIRGKKSFELSSEGSYLYDKVKPIYEQYNQTVQSFNMYLQLAKSEQIRCGIYENFNKDIVHKFKETGAELTVFWLSLNFYKLRAKLLNDELDVIITLSFDTPKMHNLEQKKLFTSKTLIGYSKNSKYNKKQLNVKDFNNETFINVDKDESIYARVRTKTVLERYKLHAKNIIELPNLDSVFLAVEKNLGVCVMDKTIDPNSDLIETFETDLNAPDVVAIYKKTTNPKYINHLVKNIIKFF